MNLTFVYSSSLKGFPTRNPNILFRVQISCCGFEWVASKLNNFFFTKELLIRTMTILSKQESLFGHRKITVLSWLLSIENEVLGSSQNVFTFLIPSSYNFSIVHSGHNVLFYASAISLFRIPAPYCWSSITFRAYNSSRSLSLLTRASFSASSSDGSTSFCKIILTFPFPEASLTF